MRFHDQADSQLVLRGETLRLAMQDRVLENSKPFDLNLQPVLGVQDLSLGGSLGHVELSWIDGDGGTLDAGLALPNQPKALDLPSNYWPDSLMVAAHAEPGQAPSGRVAVRPLRVSENTEVGVAAEAKIVETHLELDALVDSHGKHLLTVTGTVPLTPQKSMDRTAPVSGEIALHEFPVPGLPREGLLLQGTGKVEGSLNAPRAGP